MFIAICDGTFAGLLSFHAVIGGWVAAVFCQFANSR